METLICNNHGKDMSDLIDMFRFEIIESAKNNTPLPEEISDIVYFNVVENNHIIMEWI